jgi:GTP cyclohydrolase II
LGTADKLDRNASARRKVPWARKDPGDLKFSVPASLPTRFGKFQVLAVKEKGKAKEHLVVCAGKVRGKDFVPVRLHSECLTGDVMGSLRCDCRDQLEKSLRILHRRGIGILVYLRQEGRGIGLMNKIQAYSLQEKGYDTVEANQKLGFEDDLRDYDLAVRILKSIKVKSVALITNNPEKIRGLSNGGIRIAKRIPLVISPNRFNERYLRTKIDKLGHFSGKGRARRRARPTIGIGRRA